MKATEHGRVAEFLRGLEILIRDTRVSLEGRDGLRVVLLSHEDPPRVSVTTLDSSDFVSIDVEA